MKTKLILYSLTIALFAWTARADEQLTLPEAKAIAKEGYVFGLPPVATVQGVGLAPWFFNLYLDPREEMTVGHRLDPWMATVTGKLKAHAATFQKCPPKNIGL